MMKSVVSIIMILLLCGCASLSATRMAANNRVNLARLSVGMTKQKVLVIMGNNIDVYKCDLPSSAKGARAALNNPYRTETVKSMDKEYEVLYYLAELRNSDCIVDNDGLIPLVFEKSKLVGWGSAFLSGITPAGDLKTTPTGKN